MARIAKSVKLYQDIQQNPELRKINAEVSRINDLIAKMGRSEYFREISLPEQLDKYTLVQTAKQNYSVVKDYLDSIQGSLSALWNVRRSEDAIKQATGVIRSEGQYIKVLNLLPDSSVKRSQRTGRGTLSEKAVRIMIADDVEMLKRLTKKSESQIMDFLNKWYESPEVSGGQLLEKFIDGVYKSEYSGSGASQSWGSPPVKMIIEERIIETYNIEPSYDAEMSWNTEENMSNELYQAWMNLFS